MSVITLTTDWNKNDYYLAAIKGQIISQCPEARIIDISHQIIPFNIREAAFLIKNSYKHFPKGTIHIIGVNSAIAPAGRCLATEVDAQFFITYDTGIFGQIFKNELDEIIEIDILAHESGVFSEFSVFCDLACKLANGAKPNSLGKPVDDYIKTVPLRAAIEDSTIVGHVIYIDSYRNAITNITKETFERIGKNRPFEIMVQSEGNRITKINKTYGETTLGELLALFNTIDLLEIAMNHGNAADLLALDTDSSVRIKFKE
ncbi:MAG: SAM-dependent chlorinase/fluorinase [Bacteroidales bacterium]|nr:SAM-dependent chlorinase/fluorinase [Bacteroidales bacterium]